MVCFLRERVEYVEEADLYHDESIDYDLDRFRQNGTSRQHLAMCHWQSVGGHRSNSNIGYKWLDAPKNEIAEIVICRCARRNNPTYNKAYHNTLRDIQDHCVFLGFPKEHQQFVASTGLNKIARYPTDNIIKLADTISGAKVVISNQTLGFALAEAMKIPRILEVWPKWKNCMPSSNNGHVKLNQNNIRQYLE